MAKRINASGGGLLSFNVPTPTEEERIVPNTGIIMYEGKWELWYRSVKFAESDDLNYCVKKMQVLLKEDDFSSEEEK